MGRFGNTCEYASVLSNKTDARKTPTHCAKLKARRKVKAKKPTWDGCISESPSSCNGWFYFANKLATKGIVTSLHSPCNDDTESMHCPMNNPTSNITIWLYQGSSNTKIFLDSQRCWINIRFRHSLKIIKRHWLLLVFMEMINELADLLDCFMNFFWRPTHSLVQTNSWNHLLCFFKFMLLVL